MKPLATIAWLIAIAAATAVVLLVVLAAVGWATVRILDCGLWSAD